MTDHDPLDTAWRIHAAVTDWTGKAESKASFALAVESALLAAIISLTGGNHRLSDLNSNWLLLFFWLGLALVVAALLAVIAAVRPRLRSNNVKAEARDNFIFFGHLKSWNPEALQAALGQTDVLPMLTRQLVSMSEIAWKKHRLLQLSLTCAPIGTASIVVALLLK